ncbi:High potential iron-sulfur protein [Burkholderia sp. SG-MS1]|nr:High potential iron-sulfur protein [Paraburkholderia sp. SG-MS1]
MNSTRRSFLLAGAGVVCTLAVVRHATAGERADEADSVAKSLGYRIDSTKVDRARFSTYKVGDDCATCVFYKGKASDGWAPCSILGSKDVAAHGWCSAYNKRT